MPFQVSKLAASGKNYILRVAGTLDFAAHQLPALIDDLTFDSSLRGLRLDGATWLIQEKAGIRVWWSEQAAAAPTSFDPESLLLVCESRNGIRMDPGWPSPPAWGKQLWLSSFGLERVPEPPCHFTLVLDFDRHG